MGENCENTSDSQQEACESPMKNLAKNLRRSCEEYEEHFEKLHRALDDYPGAGFQSGRTAGQLTRFTGVAFAF